MKSLKNLLHASASAGRIVGGFTLVTVGLSGLMFSASPVLADISVNLQIDGPPPPRHEVIIEGNRPGPDYIWVTGYWDGSPGHYAWVGGHWDRPPHGHGHWVAPRWERDHDGHYHQIKGGWRD
jgi:hypothetical protein